MLTNERNAGTLIPFPFSQFETLKLVRTVHRHSTLTIQIDIPELGENRGNHRQKMR